MHSDTHLHFRLHIGSISCMLMTMWSFFILVLFGLVSWSSSASCPAKYERFSLEHTYCIKRNPTCDIKRSGVTQKDIQEILRAHNQYRSDLANGKETRAKGGTLPKAADMLQMVWDDELAAIAQKWAENCDFDHDCDECRVVPNFGVGQNLAIQYESCSNCKEDDLTNPKWAEAIKGLYDEVLHFHKSWLDSFLFGRADTYVEHFTQVVWSKTWRVGCGYTAYKTGKQYNRFYVCNYGPSGNVRDQPVYKQGNPCSACPVNTCCGSSCKSGPNYPGLCKMLDPATAPIYQRNLNNLLFFCDSDAKTKDCEASLTGSNKWNKVTSLQGNYMSIVLNGGETTTMVFKNKIAPKKNEFCIRFTFRKGAMKAGENDASSFKAVYKIGGSEMPMNLAISEPEFTPYSINLGWNTQTTLTLIFSVPKGAKPHILDLKEIMAFDGKCKSRKD